jgi:hypothetical protein
VVCAEGTLYEEHASWIRRYEQEGVFTVPLASVDGALEKTLFDREFTVRPERSDASWRLENTRGAMKPDKVIQGETRARGTVQMDTAAWGRYEGELHIMQKDMPLDFRSVRVAEIPDPYKAAVGFIRPHEKIRFDNGA